MRHALIAALCCISCCAGAADSQATRSISSTADWTRSRRHFSFSPITFDLDYRNWAYGSHVETLVECSNDQFLCLSSPTFSVVVPRRCADLGSGHWAAGNVRTEVLFRRVASSPPIHSAESMTTLYLGSPDHPGLLIVYDQNIGLKALYWDRGNRLDFMAMARDGQLQNWLDGRETREARERIYFPRTTFDRVGECRG